MHSVTFIASASQPMPAIASDGLQKRRQPTDQDDPFSGFIAQASQQITNLRTEADDKVKGLMAGDGTDIHTALIATQKADLAFDLALAVRNKAVGAYQQLIGMQF
jgi:flagellar hook-basal body complex protein FliE